MGGIGDEKRKIPSKFWRTKESHGGYLRNYGFIQSPEKRKLTANAGSTCRFAHRLLLPACVTLDGHDKIFVTLPQTCDFN